MGSTAQINTVDAEQLIAAAKFTASIGRTAGQNERNENALSVFATDDIKAETGGSFLYCDGSRFSGNNKNLLK